MISHRIAPSTYPGWLPFKGDSNTPQATSNPHHERFSSPQCSTNHFLSFLRACVRIQYSSAIGSLAAKCLSGPRAPVPISELVSKLLRGRCPPNGLRNKTLNKYEKIKLGLSFPFCLFFLFFLCFLFHCGMKATKLTKFSWQGSCSSVMHTHCPAIP